MNKRALAWTAATAAALALISIFVFDRAIALAVHGSLLENARVFVDGREMLDVAAGRSLLGSNLSLSNLLLGGALIALGALWWLAWRTSYFARALVFTGLTQIATIGCAWVIKDVFGRLRPNEVIALGNWDHVWFAGGNSFPSGHNAFFWGLFLPLAYLFPKYRIPLLILPLFIALARIDENYHFLSDVLAAIALASFVTLIAAIMASRWIRPPSRQRRLFK